MMELVIVLLCVVALIGMPLGVACGGLAILWDTYFAKYPRFLGGARRPE